MRKLVIRWLEDVHYCETCGLNHSTGAVVTLDGEVIFEEIPSAGCLSMTTDIEYSDVLFALCKKLDIEVEEVDVK